MKFIFLLFAFLIPVYAIAQKVENLRFEQVGKQIIIYYDLTDTRAGQTYDIQVFCSTDGSMTFSGPLQKITGDAGNNITAGTNKRVTWDVLSEKEKLVGDIFFEIHTKNTRVNNDLIRRKIIGNARTIVEAEYSATVKKKEVKIGVLLSKLTTGYDVNMNQILNESFNSDGIVYKNNKQTYRYDNDRNRIEMCRYKPDGNLELKILSKFNENGKIVESNRFNPDGSLENKSTYLRDEKGNLIDLTILKPDGSEISKDTYKYDEKGNQIEWIRGTYKSKYDYDENGNRIVQSTLKPDGSLDISSTYKYDERGKRIEWCWYRSDGGKSTYKYDEKGIRIEWIEYKTDGSINIKEVYVYDVLGNQLVCTRYKQDGSVDYIETNKFDRFDKIGNWLMQTTFRNENPTKIITREIEYY